MHHFAQPGRGRGTPVGSGTLLDLSLWQVSGYEVDNVVMTQPGGVGTPIILTQTGDDGVQVGATLIGSSYTDVTVEVEYVMTGWNTTLYADQWGPGAACRFSGTNGSANWNGYWCSQRLINTPSRRVRLREYAAGAPGTLGTETSGLPAAWVDGSTHIISQITASGTSLITRAKRLGQGAWEHEDLAATDATTPGPGLVGLWMNTFNANGGTPQTVAIHNFTVTP